MKRTTTEKATSKKAATKTSSRKHRNIKARGQAKVTVEPKVKTQTVHLHYAQTSSPYHEVYGVVHSVLIVAAFVVAGFAKFTKEGIEIDTNGLPKLFKAMVGATPYNNHRNVHARINKAGTALTTGGLTWFQARRLKTPEDLKVAKQIAVALRKGGTVEGYKFTRKTLVEI